MRVAKPSQDAEDGCERGRALEKPRPHRIQLAGIGVEIEQKVLRRQGLRAGRELFAGARSTMIRATRQGVIVAALACSFNAAAYEIGTHGVLSERAANLSVLSTQDKLRDYGLDKSILDSSQLFRNSQGQDRRIIDLITDGSRFEDTLSLFRSLNHFYNPLNGQPLTLLGGSLGAKSPGWALAFPGTVSGLEFSYWNARQSLFDALTKPGETERSLAFGRTFQTLGQVIHQLQDMSPPQHVRNDMHCDLVFLCGVLTAGILYQPSLYEKWTNSRNDLFTDPGQVGYDITSQA